ncbi:MAG: hypothetical protein JJE52_09405 [Acidimicrobiia bacterium]|nr:hypothetical protein [Acidimicrobiia bacterium]
MSAPDWILTGDTVAKLREELAEVDEATRADFDAFERFISEQLAEYKIDPSADQWATYHGLAYMSLMVYLARNNFENGAIDHTTAGAVTAIARGVAMALARHAPEGDLS